MLIIRKYADPLVFIFIIILSLFIWWPSRNLPYFWDSSGFVINAANDLFHNNFQPWIANHSNFAHPPFLMTSLAIAWRIFGQTQLTSHLIMWPFFPILLYSTYLIAKKMAIIFPLAPTLTVAALPYILAEYYNIYIDLPTAALATASVAASVYNRQLVMSLLLVCAVLTKETALLIIPGLILYFWLATNAFISTKKFKLIFYLLLPVIVWVIYLIYHNLITGWLLVEPGRQIRPLTPAIFWQSLVFIIKQIMFAQSRGFITLMAIGSLIFVQFTKTKFPKFSNPVFLMSITILVSAILFFSYIGEFALRYGIIASPFYVLSIFYLFQLPFRRYSLSKQLIITIIVLGIHLSVSYSAIHPKVNEPNQTFIFSPPDDLGVIDMITISQQSASFLSQEYPNAHIYGAFPENQQLTQPFQGYINTPLQFSECRQNTDFSNTEQEQLVYFHLYSPVQQYCGNALIWHEHKLINKFAQNGKWIAIYKIGKKLSSPNEFISL